MMIVAGYLAAYPELDARAYLSADGQAGVDAVEQGCLDEVLQGLVDADTQGWSSPPDSPGREEWQRVLDENTPGRRASDVPVIVVHGRDDTTVLATSSEAYQRRACLAGADVGRVVYPGVGHVDVLTGTDAVARSIGWFESWLSGRSAGPGCS